MYAKNVVNLLQHIYPKGNSAVDFTDEIVKGCCITHDGKIVHEAVRKSFEQGGN